MSAKVIEVWEKVRSRTRLISYGRSIPIIARELITSSIREKRFYLAAIYFIAIPIISNLFDGQSDIVFKGSGIALFYAQVTTLQYIKSFYLSFLLGQILLIILSADQIAGEIELKTFALIRSKPVYDSEIIFGKFLGMLGIMSILDLPGLFIVYFSYLIGLDADYPGAYFGTLDEIIAVYFIVLIFQGIIIALTLLFSTIFNKSLYAILGAMLSLFILSAISDSNTAGGADYNYISINWLLDAFLPYVFYHLEPLEDLIIPSLTSLIFGLLAMTLSILGCAVLILRNKEIQ